MSQSPLAAFPRQPSKAVEPSPSSRFLPVQPTPLIGRIREVETASKLLQRSDVRLLTLSGPPGIGKTRLALEITSNLAQDFADGTYLVPLAPITESRLVLATIAQSVGIREAPGQPLSESLANYLRDRQVLLLLDNFEQVIEAATGVAELLSHCPDLKLLVTSRELLHIYGEHDYPVPPLTLPDTSELPDLEALLQCEAVSLFMRRAQAVSPGFELTGQSAHAIAEICVRLDGMPLAIELAAARILVLPPEELLARLKNGFALLRGGPRNLPDRQQSLRATLDWSYNLLEPDEQALFRRLGVFVGGCGLEAIEQVCGNELAIDILDGVTSLFGKSLLQRHENVVGSGEARFTMLETIREYAREMLAEANASNGVELHSTRERHCAYFLQLAEASEQGILGNEQTLWMRRLDTELNNLRAALEWSVATEGPGGVPNEGGGGTEKGLRLAGALIRYWDNRGYFSEGQQWCTQLLSKTASSPEITLPSKARAKVLRALARTLWQQGDFTEARSIYEASLEMSRALHDDWGLAAALLGLGNVAMWSGEYDLSLSLNQECLAIGRRLGDRYMVSAALNNTGIALVWKGDYRAAPPPLEEALTIDRELGNIAGIANDLLPQGVVAFELGEHRLAKALIEESLGIAREVGLERIIAGCLAQLGMIALRKADPQLAQTFLLEGITRAQVSGTRRWSRWYLVGLAEVARLQGMGTHAAKLIGASEGVLTAAGAHYEVAISSEIDRIIGSVSADLDEDTFARLRGEGRAMSVEEVLAYAGQSRSDPPSQSEPLHTPARRSVGPGETGTPGERELAPYPDDLTEREVQVLRLIAAGKSNQQIAEELVLSLRTVERHISNIYQKIGAIGKVARASAATYALTRGLS